MLKYNEFIKLNEEAGFFGKALRSLQDWAAQPLNDFLRTIQKSGDPVKIVNMMRTYMQTTIKDIDKELKAINSEDGIKKYLHDQIFSVYTALKGVQATQKVNKTYFDEIFNDADKNLSKVMSNPPDKINPAIDNYINTILIPGMKKVSGIRENKIYEADIVEPDTKPENLKKDDKEPQQKPTLNDNDLKKLKLSVKTWMTKIFEPILKTPMPKVARGKENIIPTVDDSVVRREVVQDIVRNADLDDVIKFRDMVARRQGVTNPKDKWPVGRQQKQQFK